MGSRLWKADVPPLRAGRERGAHRANFHRVWRPAPRGGAGKAVVIVMAERKSISASMRFEIFKRDSFTCQYCGRKAPDVLLHVDHVVAVANGGDNDPLNLVTACAGCNLGKGAKLLSDRATLSVQIGQIEELHARREQVEMLMRWKQEVASVDDETIAKLESYLSSRTPGGFALTANARGDLRKWMREFSVAELAEAIDAAVIQYLDVDSDTGSATDASCNEAFSLIPRICRMKRIEREKPHLKELFYVRGIVRNRCVYFDPNEAIGILEDAFDVGIPIDALKSIARGCRNWSSWRADMYEAIAAQKPGLSE